MQESRENQVDLRNLGGGTSREIKIVLCETMLSLKRVLSSDNKNIKTQSFELKVKGCRFFFTSWGNLFFLPQPLTMGEKNNHYLSAQSLVFF